MITMFQTYNPAFSLTRISRAEVTRVTANSVWIDGRRIAKKSGLDYYHDTWTAARDYLIDVASRKRDRVSRELNDLNDALKRLHEMKEPKS